MAKTIRVHTLAVLHEGESFFAIEPVLREALRAMLYERGYRPITQVLWSGVPSYTLIPDDLHDQAESLLKMMRDNELQGRLILCAMTGSPLRGATPVTPTEETPPARSDSRPDGG